jgi:hypothetical protein
MSARSVAGQLRAVPSVHTLAATGRKNEGGAEARRMDDGHADPSMGDEKRSSTVILVGCSGFPCARSEYYRSFPLVEIQQTFYKLPRLQTALRWRQ